MEEEKRNYGKSHVITVGQYFWCSILILYILTTLIESFLSQLELLPSLTDE